MKTKNSSAASTVFRSLMHLSLGTFLLVVVPLGSIFLAPASLVASKLPFAPGDFLLSGRLVHGQLVHDVGTEIAWDVDLSESISALAVKSQLTLANTSNKLSGNIRVENGLVEASHFNGNLRLEDVLPMFSGIPVACDGTFSFGDVSTILTKDTLVGSGAASARSIQCVVRGIFKFEVKELLIAYDTEVEAGDIVRVSSQDVTIMTIQHKSENVLLVRVPAEAKSVLPFLPLDGDFEFDQPYQLPVVF